MPIALPKTRGLAVWLGGSATLTAGSSAHTKATSWTQVVSDTGSLPLNALTITVHSNQSDTNARRYAIDIAFGAAASETVVIPNLFLRDVPSDIWSTGTNTIHGPTEWTITIPIDVPKNTRIAAKCQSSSGFSQVNLEIRYGYINTTENIYGINHGIWEPIGVVTSSDTNTTCGGVNAISPNATAWVFGSWVEITASTSSPYRAVIPIIGSSGGLDAGTRICGVQFGMGAAASETVLFETIHGVTGFNGAISNTVFPVSIPQGTRLAARINSSAASSTDSPRIYLLGLRGA